MIFYYESSSNVVPESLMTTTSINPTVQSSTALTSTIKTTTTTSSVHPTSTTVSYIYIKKKKNFIWTILFLIFYVGQNVD